MTTPRPEDLSSNLAGRIEKILEKPSLASVAVVSRLLRESFGNAIIRRGDYFAGNAPDAAARDVADMDALSRLLQGGGGPEYLVQPWNAESQMGEHVKQAYGMECERGDAVFTLLLSVLGTIYEQVDEAGSRDGESSRKIDTLIEQTTAVLLGLPWKSAEGAG
jgi:hypothetical protein